jgi:hypothetical protein
MGVHVVFFAGASPQKKHHIFPPTTGFPKDPKFLMLRRIVKAHEKMILRIIWQHSGPFLGILPQVNRHWSYQMDDRHPLGMTSVTCELAKISLE